MRIDSGNYINLNRVVIFLIFVIIFMLPINFFRELGLPLDEYLFAAIILIYYFNYTIKNGKMKVKDLILLPIILYFCIINSTISHLHLIGLIIVDKLIDNEKTTSEYINTSKILLISLMFVFIYSIIYLGYNDRYIYTGLKEANQGGLTLLLLFLMIRIKYKNLGNILLILGLLTFSKSYLLGLCIFFVVNTIINNKSSIAAKIIVSGLKNFKVLSIISILLLILISSYFSNLHKLNLLQSYGQGVERFFTITDYSNYFRFIVNTNLLEIYKQNPEKLLTGMSSEEFINYNREIAVEGDQAFREIRPHNYFFSYLRIYGVFSLVIFWYLSTIFKRVVVKENLSIFLIIFSYIIFLGTGVTSYWLFLSIVTLLFYKKVTIDVRK
ncbi:hypothetical protein [Bacillus sp. CGMCC 1.16541]|uniref:hypothetical protein n=1 Tax=Bacillus sp. CGMCC 1.16541 TaxID=2185143 RepID=UPI000D72F87A|nr:hypothetical protein [Bacillus sp. CGMCC 1.16541]